MKKGFIKYSFTLLIMGILPSLAMAGGNEGPQPNFFPNLLFYLIAGVSTILILFVLIALFRAFTMILKLREIEIYKEQGLTEYLEAENAKKISWWDRFNQKMTDTVPLTEENDILLDHNYDGIRELDNNLPPWWLYGFYFTIGIAIFYMGFYHFSSYAKSSTELYAIEMEEAQDKVNQYLATRVDKIDENNLSLLTDEESLTAGKTLYTSNCVACHLASGGGSIGPNLTDKYWIHGGSIKDVFATVKYGIPEKGMISWKDQMSPSDMHKVSSYLLSLQGTNPADGKEAQGKEYKGE